MPTVMETGWGKVKVCIYFDDHGLPHVHMLAPGAKAKIEIASSKVVASRGFSEPALTKLRAFVSEHKAELMEAWNEYQE